MNLEKTAAIFLSFILSISLFAEQEKIIKDAQGVPFRISSQPPQRIISLAPNITEILYALKLEKEIVGVTRYCDYPEQAQKKEKIGGMIDPSLEKIKALNPDLIIGFRGNPLRIIKRMRSLDLPVFVLEMDAHIESVFTVIEKIGSITHRNDEAELLIKSLQKKYDGVQSALRDVQYKPKIFLSLQEASLWTCGEESFLNDLISKAKGINIAGNIQRKWLFFNREQLIHEDPEVIIILSKSREEFNKAKDWVKTEAHLEETQAVKNDTIYFMDENLVSRPGPRLINALTELARLLHPQCFEHE